MEKEKSIADKVLQNIKSENKADLLISKTGNDWLKEAKSQPIPKMLFSEFWHEGELCILFAETGAGKSILAVQIANAISKGNTSSFFKVTAQRQKVLYFDFELSPKQFEKRYSMNYENHYEFDDNFIRSEMNPEGTTVIDFEAELFLAIEREIEKHKAKVLIIDNLTYLKTQSTETAKEALPLMNMLISLKRKHKLSILGLAHTPKRDHSKPISINDVSGSKHLSNFSDSIFAIGVSNKESYVRYLKQIKARATEKIYDAENVIVCLLENDFNFLCFKPTEYGKEYEHLKFVSEEEQSEIERQIIELFNQNPQTKEREIARRLNTNHKKVGRVLKKNNLK